MLSGILLGIAIYTKIPAFTMIPLVGYLIYTILVKHGVIVIVIYNLAYSCYCNTELMACLCIVSG